MSGQEDVGPEYQDSVAEDRSLRVKVREKVNPPLLRTTASCPQCRDGRETEQGEGDEGPATAPHPFITSANHQLNTGTYRDRTGLRLGCSTLMGRIDNLYVQKKFFSAEHTFVALRLGKQLTTSYCYTYGKV